MQAHGTRASYQAGCHCTPCRAANAAYMASALIPANTAQAKLAELEAQQIGVRQAARLSGVSVSTIQAIRSGARDTIRARSEQRILAIVPALARGQRVNGYRTRQLLKSLKGEGFTEPDLARRLGLASERLQFHHACITVRNALKVRALWRFHVGDDALIHAE